jgi:hypothetical protein
LAAAELATNGTNTSPNAANAIADFTSVWRHDRLTRSIASGITGTNACATGRVSVASPSNSPVSPNAQSRPDLSAQTSAAIAPVIRGTNSASVITVCSDMTRAPFSAIVRPATSPTMRPILAGGKQSRPSANVSPAVTTPSACWRNTSERRSSPATATANAISHG